MVSVPEQFATQSQINARKARAFRLLVVDDLRRGMTQAEIAAKYRKTRQVIWRHVQRARGEGLIE